MKHVKICLSFLLSFAILTTMILPVGYAEESYTTIDVTEDTAVRSGSDGETDYSSAKQLYIQNVGDASGRTLRRTYLKFDLSNDTANSTTLKEAVCVTLKLQRSADVTIESTANMTVHGLTDTAKTNCVTSGLTYNSTVTNGLEAFSNPIAAAVVTADMSVVEVDVTDYVKAQEDGIYAFKLVAESTLIGFYSSESTTSGAVKPCLVAYSVAPADKAAVTAAADALTVSGVVKESFTLPVANDNGAAIAWSSDNSAIMIDGANATVTPSEDENHSVTLTATVTKGIFTETRTFNVIVPASSHMYSVGVSEDTWVRSSGGKVYEANKVLIDGAEYAASEVPDGITATTADVLNYSNTKLYAQNAAEAGGAFRRTYLKFEPSAADIAKLQGADRVTLRMQRYTGTGAASENVDTATVTVHGLTETTKTWDSTTLTYNTSTDASNNLEAFSNPIASLTGIPETCEFDVTDYVKAQADGVYAFKLVGDDNLMEFHSNDSETASARPCLVAYDVADELVLTINGEAQKLTDPLKAGTAALSWKVYKNGSVNPEGMLIAALYDTTSVPCVLKNVVVSDLSGTITDGGEHTYEATLTIDQAENRVLKVFLWKGWDMIPILPATIIGSN